MLDEFGVNNEFFPRSTNYYLLQGFYVISWGLLAFLKNIIFYGWIAAIPLGMAFFIVNLNKIPKINRWLEKKRAQQNNEYTLVSLFFETVAFMIVTLFLPILVISIFGLNYIVFAELSNDYGKESSKLIIENFDKNKGCDLDKDKPYDCAFVFSSNQELLNDGVVVAKHEDEYLLWDGKTAQIYKGSKTSIKFKNGKHKDQFNSQP